ncbi:MAG: redox-sensing transcriptional repressor Rex [Candidatus Omnitrophica bacterium]|nr:redox-sensing transcriptional repressor Rex [Candidatus Omnitrophota bacterium]MBU4457321.1 redox-sensing transcriptional repressor Rex [Candidatus Omnitrophota bacterium]
MKIPSPSIPRISLYYRVLLSLKDKDIISSQELSELTGCSAAQVRKDLAYFGQFGRPGSGYNVEVLKTELKNILGIDKDWDVALIGAGNLGSALLAYKGFRGQGFNIKYVFDNDRKKIGKLKQGIKVRDILELKKATKQIGINLAVVAVPQEAAQEVIDELVLSGIKAILNFAPIRPRVSEDIKVLNIDLSTELERLSYFLQRRKV